MARMVRMADIEALISEIDMAISQGYCARSLEDMKHRLNQIPTVDAVEVVRCKDCRFNVENMKNDPLDATDYSDITCSYFMTDGMDAEGFCCRGEKMDGGVKE